MEPLRVLIADDSSDFRRGLRALLDAVDGIDVVGESADGRAAVELALRCQPDVVLMDLNMPELNGVEATRAVVAAAPHIAVLVLTMHDDDEAVFAAVQAGARGYLVKGARQGELTRAIRSVGDGGAVFGPSVARRLVALLSTPPPVDPASSFPELTAREREVLDRIARGRSNLEIANELVLAPKTVRNHVSSIFTKLQVVDRAQAIVKAREAGIGRR